MPVVINGITCGELVKGYQESVNEGKVAATKKYICYWPQRFQVANGLLGFSRGTRGGGTTFVPAMRHPEIRGIIARSISIEPVGVPYDWYQSGGGYYRGGWGSLASWESAIITAHFSAPEWPAIQNDDPAGDQSIDPDTKFLYCTQDIDYGSESHTIPGSSMAYKDSGGTIRKYNHEKTIRVQHAELGLTFHKLPYMPVNFLPLIDHVNDAKFLGGEKGTVMFNGGKTHREYQSDGSITQSVSMSFSYRPTKEWNKVPDPKGGSEWVTLFYNSGAPIFPYSDLTVVFPPGYAY